MVLIESLKITEEASTLSEMKMESGHCIPYVAPFKYSQLANCANEHFVEVVRRKLSGNTGDEQDKWEGVSELCQVLDNAIFVENDVKMFADKRILEIGFCTGLPSAFAHSQGASSVALHCNDRKSLDSFVRTTLRRNNLPRSRSKLHSGDYESFKLTLSAQKYDVILAPELLYTDASEFELIHEVLDAALAPNGIILFSARPYYSDCSGSLPKFLDLVKMKGVFDAHTRWNSPKSDCAARKIIQMNRAIR